MAPALDSQYPVKNSGSHDPAKTLGLECDLGEGSFIFPHRTSQKQIVSTNRKDLRLLSKPVYFPEWFDNVEMSSHKWLDYKDDEDDLGNVPESWTSLSCTVEFESLSPIIPDVILLSESLEDILNITRAEITELVLDGWMTRVTCIPADDDMGQMSLSDSKIRAGSALTEIKRLQRS